MATDLFKGFDSQKPSFRTNMLEDASDPNFNFNIENTELFKGAANTAQKQMAGDVPQFDTYANETREAQKAQQANAANAGREALFSSGMANTGRRLQFEMATPNQQARERTELERGLTADRSSLAMQQQQQGVQNATALAGMQQQGAQFERSDATQRYGIDVGRQNVLDQLASGEKMEQQRIDLDKNALYGYTDANGNYVPGQMDLAYKQFGLNAKTLENAEKELFGYTDPKTGQYVPGKMYLMNAQDQRDAAALFGYVDPSTGKYVPGSLRINAQMADIQEVLAGFEGQRVQQSADAMYGYIDPVTGKQVKGTAEIAQEMLGLETLRYEDQRKELYGYTDPVTGKVIKGKYEMLSDSQKMAADELYGYTDPETGIKVAGTLELQNIATEISQQGMTIEEAKLKGYQDPVTGQWVDGMAAIAMKQVGIDIERMQNEKNALYGYTKPDGTYVSGSIQNAADALGLQGRTLDMQERELWGYTDENGNHVKGKYDLLSEEQKRDADRLYGYYDKEKDEWVPGEFEAQKQLMELQGELAMKGINIQTTLEYLRTTDPDAAAEIVNQIAIDAGITYKDDNGNDVPGVRPMGAEREAQFKLSGYIDKLALVDGKFTGRLEPTEAAELSAAIANGDAIPFELAGPASVGNDGDTTLDLRDLEMLRADDSGKGYDRWKLTDAARRWAESNRGKLWRDPVSGRVYQITGPSMPGERYSVAGVGMIDVATGQEFVWKNTEGARELNGRKPAGTDLPLNGYTTGTQPA